jgi:hypothetical protein
LSGAAPENYAALGSRLRVRQYLNGFITEEHWRTVRAEPTGMLSWIPEWRRDVLENCSIFRESFCAEIKAAVERIKPSEK